jgi:hypothetical protein
MSYTACTVPPSGVTKDTFKTRFSRSVLACLTWSITFCSPGWSQTPIRELSGIGAQASAHGVNGSGVLMDVQVLFNANQ